MIIQYVSCHGQMIMAAFAFFSTGWDRWSLCLIVPEGYCSENEDLISSIALTNVFSLNRGDCGSCTVSVGGSRIKACVGKVPPMPRLKSLQEKGLEVK